MHLNVQFNKTIYSIPSAWSEQELSTSPRHFPSVYSTLRTSDKIEVFYD